MKFLVTKLMIFLTCLNIRVHGQDVREGSASEEVTEDYIIEDNFVLEGGDYEESGDDDDFCGSGKLPDVGRV